VSETPWLVDLPQRPTHTTRPLVIAAGFVIPRAPSERRKEKGPV